MINCFREDYLSINSNRQSIETINNFSIEFPYSNPGKTQNRVHNMTIDSFRKKEKPSKISKILIPKIIRNNFTLKPETHKPMSNIVDKNNSVKHEKSKSIYSREEVEKNKLDSSNKDMKILNATFNKLVKESRNLDSNNHFKQLSIYQELNRNQVLSPKENNFRSIKITTLDCLSMDNYNRLFDTRNYFSPMFKTNEKTPQIQTNNKNFNNLSIIKDLQIKRKEHLRSSSIHNRVKKRMIFETKQEQFLVKNTKF